MSKKIKVLVKEEGKIQEWREIENKLEVMQEIVGGWLDVVRLPKRIDMWIDDEGIAKGRPINVFVLEKGTGRAIYAIHGSIFFASSDRNGETISLNQEQTDWLKENIRVSNAPDDPSFKVIAVFI